MGFFDVVNVDLERSGKGNRGNDRLIFIRNLVVFQFGATDFNGAVPFRSFELNGGWFGDGEFVGLDIFEVGGVEGHAGEGGSGGSVVEVVYDSEHINSGKGMKNIIVECECWVNNSGDEDFVVFNVRVYIFPQTRILRVDSPLGVLGNVDRLRGPSYFPNADILAI